MFIDASHLIEVIDDPRLVIWTSQMVLKDVGVRVTDHILLGVLVLSARELKT